MLYNPRLEHTHLQIQFVPFKSNFILFFSYRAQSHHCGFGQCWKDNHPLPIVSLERSKCHTAISAWCHILKVSFFSLTLTVWQRKPYKLHPPLEATLRRSLYTKHTSWFGISAGRRASGPAGTRTTATQRYGFLNVCRKTDWNIHLCWDLYLKQLSMHICWWSCFP